MELQMKLLGDHVRNQAFFDALKKVIRPGVTTIADIGSGTGFLSFLASKLGAKMCYLYEQDEALLELSRKIANENKITNCRFVPLHSSQVKQPEKVDVVISETLGNYALEEHIIENLGDARRFLKPGGMILPSCLEQWIAPVTNKRILDEMNPWDHVGFDVNLQPAKHAALNNMYVAKIHASDLLKKDCAKKWDEVDFHKKEKSVRAGKANWTMDHRAAIFGFAVWWKCTLAPGMTLSTSPFSPSTHWDQIFLPLEEPLAVNKNDRLEIHLASDTRYQIGVRLKWETRIFHQGKTLKEALFMDTGRGVA